MAERIGFALEAPTKGDPRDAGLGVEAPESPSGFAQAVKTSAQPRLAQASCAIIRGEEDILWNLISVSRENIHSGVAYSERGSCAA